MESIGRNSIIVNLDFANDRLPYIPAIDVCELITVEVNIFFLILILYLLYFTTVL